VFGVFDAAGPQVFFAESRERALAEIERANEIVRRYPNTISMRHLRDMDTAWRVARGLPVLPEPAGRRILVPAAPEFGARGVRDDDPQVEQGAPLSTQKQEAAVPLRGPVAAFLAASAEASAGGGLRERAETALADLRRTAELAEELEHATAAADRPLARFRAALQPLYGSRATEAEAGFRRIALEEGIDRAVALLRDDPRSLLSGPRPRLLPGGVHARATAAEQAVACAPALRRLDQALADACAHVGLSGPAAADAVEVRRIVLERLRDLQPAQRVVAEEALADYRRLGAQLTSTDRLRGAWSALSPAEQEEVRLALPNVEAQLGLPARGRTARDR
jgi:hypothetical protein